MQKQKHKEREESDRITWSNFPYTPQKNLSVGNMHIRKGKLNGSTSFTIYNMHYVYFRIQV